MTDPDDTWTRRDQPVLRAITNAVDAGRPPDARALSDATGLTVDEVELSVAGLRRRGVVIDRGGRGLADAFGRLDVTGEAYQLVGLHPDPDADVRDRLVSVLEQLADQSSGDDSSTLRRIGGQVGTLSRDTVAALAAALAAGGIAG